MEKWRVERRVDEVEKNIRGQKQSKRESESKAESKWVESPNIKLRKAQGVSTLFNGIDIRVYHSHHKIKGASF
jgi:hypothetical protein